MSAASQGPDSIVSSGAVSDIEAEKNSLQMPGADLVRAAQSRLSPIAEPSSSVTDEQATDSDQPSATEPSQPTLPVPATTHIQVPVLLQDERVEPAEVRNLEVSTEPALESSQVEQLYTTPEKSQFWRFRQSKPRLWGQISRLCYLAVENSRCNRLSVEPCRVPGRN